MSKQRTARPYPFRNAVAGSALCCLFLFCAHADQITLKNGDRVSGTIIKMDGKKISMKSDQFGDITTTWDQVTAVSTAKPVTVVLSDGRVAQGTLTPAGTDIEVATANARITVTPSALTAIRGEEEQRAYEELQHPRLTQLWAGTAAIGFAGATGNATTLNFTGAVAAARVTNNDKTAIYFNTIRSSATVAGVHSQTANAERGGISYDHNLTSRLFANVFNDDESDQFQALDFRFVAGGGLGFHLTKSERSRLDLLGGADYNHAKYFTYTRNSPEVFFGDDYSLKLRGATSVVETFRIFDDPTNTSFYRMNADIGFTTKVSKWLNWNVALSDRYLHHPVPFHKTNDFIYSTGLGIAFATK